MSPEDQMPQNNAAENRITAAFQDLNERSAWLDATRNQAPGHASPAPNRNRPSLPRRPLVAIAAAVLTFGGGMVAINAFQDDAQVVETGPTDTTAPEETDTTPAEGDSTDQTDETDGDGTGDEAADPDTNTVTVVTEDGQTIEVDGAGGFTSPSGNIACNISSSGASCWIGEKTWQIEQPTHDPFCAESDWGNAIDVSADGILWPCYTDFGWPIDAEPLAYGDTMQAGEFSCTSAEDGVTCTNGVGQGFRLARSTFAIFPDPRSEQQVWLPRTAVAADTVAADTDDPFLNVRATPAPDGELVAKLPPDYTGMTVTGRTETLESGAEWIEVLLLDPVEDLLNTTQSSGYPNGWVNAALTVDLLNGVSVGTDQFPGCTGFAASETGDVSDGYVYSLEHTRLTDSCDRVVVSFGSGDLPLLGEVTGAPARSATVPAASLDDAGATAGYTTIDLGPISDAWVGATDNRAGVYLVRGEDGFLDIAVAFPVEAVIITPLTDRLVIDLVSPGEREAPAESGAVALLAEPIVGPGSVSLAGVARPFEASLDASIEDASGEPVEATFTGSGSLGTRIASTYGVRTSDWLSAWGVFDLTIEQLEPGDYTIVLDSGQGGPTFTLRYDITIP
ncbi:MAG: DUF6636 domain-containing protein [Actinomycetota bacterium]